MAQKRKRQVKRGKKHKKSKIVRVLKKQQYLIHDNGGRPFVVQTDVLKNSRSGTPVLYILKNKTKQQIARYNYAKMWVPKDSSKNKEFTGNSILALLPNNKYLYIGAEIYEFKPACGDKIVKYVSNVGNSDVPYPYAIGKKYVYIMLDKVYCKKSNFSRSDLSSDEVYDVYYRKKREQESIVEGKIKICKQVSKRL